MYLPTTQDEVTALGWDQLDVILITGDSYIDSPAIGVAVIGKVLLNAGYRVGIIAQPDTTSRTDITRLGEPLLFWGVTAGCVDSMVANYTAGGKRRKQDDYTPGGHNTRRPDRAVIVYANLIRRFFKPTVPIVLGGIEASLRRIPHYDTWSNRLRRAILFDAKADVLVYGMGETAVLALADRLKRQEPFTEICGICYIAATPRSDCIELESFEQVAADSRSFSRMFCSFYQNNDPVTAKGLCQKHGGRYLIHMPPCPPLSASELDAVHELDYERELHPYYRKNGEVRALDTIRFSITSHRGCYGECSFCAIAIHQGRAVQSRSPASILREVRQMTRHTKFKGIISDVGGPTANMYGFECRKKMEQGACRHRRCLHPDICKHLPIDHEPQTRLLAAIRDIEGVRRVFVASGIRYDLILEDPKSGMSYLTEIIQHHISGQLKIAPEHSASDVLDLMGKPGADRLITFKNCFGRIVRESGKPLHLTYYFMAGHPGCTKAHMRALNSFISRHLHIIPEQVQIFTPTPSTTSTLIYYTGEHPETGQAVFCEKNPLQKDSQKRLLQIRNK
jgi:uncharacterized radical SAM protein YgiQ